MEEVYAELAERVVAAARGLDGDGKKHMVCIAGVPGAGKSTTSVEVCREVNARWGGGEGAVVVPMDGFHYYRRQLDLHPDPELAHARRGAEWTFDSPRLLDCLWEIRSRGEASVPSFDHAKGDPVEDAIQVLQTHRVVLCEGNYLLLSGGPWGDMAPLFDETWFVDCSVDEAMERVFHRQVDIGLEPEVSRGRIAGNDRPNAELIMTTKSRADLVVPSLPLRVTG